MIKSLLNRITDLFLSFVYKVFIHHDVLVNDQVWKTPSYARSKPTLPDEQIPIGKVYKRNFKVWNATELYTGPSGTVVPNMDKTHVTSSGTIEEVPVDPVVVRDVTEEEFNKSIRLSINKSYNFVKKLISNNELNLVLQYEFSLGADKDFERNFTKLKKVKSKFFRMIMKEPMSEYIVGYVLKLHHQPEFGYFYKVLFIINSSDVFLFNRFIANYLFTVLNEQQNLYKFEEYYINDPNNKDIFNKINIVRLITDLTDEEYAERFTTPDNSRTVIRKVL